MAERVRRIAVGPFGTFRYDPRRDRYEFDARAQELLGELAHSGARYVDMLARMPKAARSAYEEWRMEAVEAGAGRVRVPFELPSRRIILEIQIQEDKDGVRGLLSDATQDEQEYRSLREQLRVMNFAERIARFGTWAYDLQADSFTATKGAVDLLLPGANPSEFTFERILELVREEDRSALREAHLQALHTGQVQRVEFRPTRGERWFVIQFMRVLDDDGQPVQTCGMIHDTTDLHTRAALEAEHEELKEAQETRALFVNAAAHELSQPMTPLRLQLALLRTILPEREDVQHGLQVIERNLERVGYILNDLMDAARSQCGRLKVQLESVQVPEHVSHVVSTLSELALQRRVVLDWEPTTVPAVRVDVMRFQQCVSNLVHNAIKFTREGSRVGIRVHAERGDVLVVVEDQGPGLDERQQARLFEPFEQIHSAPPGFPGTGLGLYITRALMHAMGGSVEVESEPGEGSRFTLHFPTARSKTNS